MRDWTAMVTAFDDDRREEFLKVFGTARVPVLSPFGKMAELPGFDEPQLVYELDLDRLMTEQRKRLVTHIAEKFGLCASEVEAHLDEEGMPILASGCVASGIDIRHFL